MGKLRHGDFALLKVDQLYHLYVQSKIEHKQTSLPNRNRPTDTENRRVGAKEEEGEGREN